MKSGTHKNGSDFAITARNLTRRFGNIKALDGFGLQVKTGAVCGLIGNNGAGKTTAIHILLGLIPPNSGKMSVLGCDPAHDNIEILKRVGFFPEKVEPYEWMKVKILFQMGAHSWPTWCESTCHKLSRDFDLDTSKTVKNLSKGMLAKAKLIFALSHHPECLILDEPISGLDPAARDELLSIIRDLTQTQNITTLMSSHSLHELADIATDITIIHNGRNRFNASMLEIQNHIAVLECRQPDLHLPPNLKDQRIHTLTDNGITQHLLKNKQNPDLRNFLQQLSPNQAVLKEISLKNLFLFIAKDKMATEE